jgi:heat shock protein HslJ
MRRRISAVGFAAAALMLISSLGSTALAAGSGGTLEGTVWVLTRYADGGTMVDVPASVEATATFDAGRIAGKGGCNGFGGDYTVSGASITFGPLISTMMACGSPQDDVEKAYFADLGKAATYTASGGALTMYDASGAELLVFTAGVPVPLSGPTWHLASYNNGKQAVVGVVAGTDPTIIFGADGTTWGNATCNQFNGTYDANDPAIKIGPLASTRMACPTTEQQDQETAYLAALEAATTYAISGGTLELRDASGALQASFVAGAETPMPVDIGGGTGATEPTAPATSTTPDAGEGTLPTGALAILAILGAAFVAAAVILPLRTARNR